MDVYTTKDVTSSRSLPSCISDGRYLSGIMLKKRRKKLRGFGRRYFSLDYKYGTLNYFSSQNSSILRGSMPIKLCVVSAREKSRDIYIDSGMEVWNVKPLNSTDFKTWVAALDVARLGASTIAHHNPKNYANSLLQHIPSSDISKQLSLLLTGTSQPLPTEFPQTLSSANNNQYPPHVGNDDTKVWDRLETLVERLESTATKINEHQIKQDRQGSSDSILQLVDNGLGNTQQQRRSSFWKRRSSRLPSVSQPVSPAFELGPTDVTHSSETLDNGLGNSVGPGGFPASTPSTSLFNEVLFDLKDLATEFRDALREARLMSHSITRNPSMDISSVFSDEFFDAEENGMDLEGVVYLEANDSGESDEEEDEALEDSESASDVEGDLVGSDTHLPLLPREAIEDQDHVSNLYPLTIIKEVPVRRATIPVSVASPPNFLSIIRKNVGKDMTSIAMPVTANEPLTVLQRFAEMFEPTALIDFGLSFPEGSAERIMHIATFGAVFASSNRVKERSGRKPFMPLLGETFEFVRVEQGMRMVIEKICHRPLVLAIQAESVGWTLQYSPTPQQQIWGKSIELNNKGKLRLTIISTGEVYEWSEPTTFMRNIIAGEKYVEPVGKLSVVCSNGWRSVFEYKAGGMFSGRSEDMRAKVFSPDGKECLGYELEGKWTDSVSMITPMGGKKTIWTAGPLVEGYAKRFGFTQFAASLNEITVIEQDKMSPRDSRLRPDQQMYENGDVDGSQAKKLELEQKQRERRSELEKTKTKYEPVFFEQHEGDLWCLKKGSENYWERRKRGDWTGMEDIFA